MDNQTVINTTGEPVTEQAPAVDTTSTSTSSSDNAPGYLSEGYNPTTESVAKTRGLSLLGSMPRSWPLCWLI